MVKFWSEYTPEEKAKANTKLEARLDQYELESRLEDANRTNTILWALFLASNWCWILFN